MRALSVTILRLSLMLLVSITLALSAVSIGAAQQSANAPINGAEREQMILLSFESLNKRVWLLGVGPADVHVARGTLPKATVGRGRESIYALKDSVTVDIGTTRIAFSETEIVINGQAMGSALNAVVAKDGHVSIGAFVRDFD